MQDDNERVRPGGEEPLPAREEEPLPAHRSRSSLRSGWRRPLIIMAIVAVILIAIRLVVLLVSL